ncbi:MAG: hypothetical protein N2169_02345, partial [bacterium]|nr:hypothetical protein [bacterium]
MIKKILGMTIIEVLLSISIAIILIMSLYMIVYWGSEVSTVNQKIMNINNIMTFIQQDMINNTPLYFELDNNGMMIKRQDIDINTIIKERIKSYIIDLKYIKAVKFISLEREQKPNTNWLAPGYFDNLYRASIQIEWEHKKRKNKYKTDFLLSSYSLKKITTNQNLSDYNININLPDNFLTTISVVIYTGNTTSPDPTTTTSPPTTSTPPRWCL